MTNQEAIKIIQMERNHCASHNQDIGKSDEYHKEMQDMVDAFDLAIKALEERPQGEWITVHYAREELNCPEKSMLDFVKCPFCETIHQGRHNFCSRCGADMRGENNDKILDDTNCKIYRNEKCDRAGKCIDYIGWHCAGCNGAKESNNDVSNNK